MNTPPAPKRASEPSHLGSSDLCPRPTLAPVPGTIPLTPPIYPASVYQCTSAEQAQALLDADNGTVYQRDGHPNAEWLAAKCQQLHEADWTVTTSSGMAALGALLLSALRSGDHVVASEQLYGRSLQLLVDETARMGIGASVVDTTDLAAVEKALTDSTRLVVVETISNPLLRVAQLDALSELAHARGARLLVDNTFASPLLCRPLQHGADWVMESISKIINGHSDVMLGMIAGRNTADDPTPKRIRDVVSAWGFASSPFECWLALRGLSTLHLRLERACENAWAVARFLANHPAISRVLYPGLECHADHAIAQRQFGGQFGWMITFDVASQANELIQSANPEIPFCPSLGEVSTTLSHPASTSHRRHSPDQLAQLGIGFNTLRLSVGTESCDHLLEVLNRLLSGLTG